MSFNLFNGLITALITPFKNGQLDFAALENLINYQIKKGVNALVIGGSTGEGSSLTLSEYKMLLQTSSELASRRIKLIAGCSSNNTELTIEIARVAEKAGMDGFMCSLPPYIKPTQQGIYEHFKIIHNSTQIPIMLYSVPSRTIVDFSDNIIVRLAELERVYALKDAGIDIERPLRLKNLVKENFNFLCGNDDLALAYNAQGGGGCVSVISNVVPELARKLQEFCKIGDYKSAFDLQLKLLPLYKAIFSESNPIGIKCAAAVVGLCENELRLPLTSALPVNSKKISEVIEKYFTFEKVDNIRRAIINE